jgi:hypothetical protein
MVKPVAAVAAQSSVRKHQESPAAIALATFASVAKSIQFALSTSHQQAKSVQFIKNNPREAEKNSKQ